MSVCNIAADSSLATVVEAMLPRGTSVYAPYVRGVPLDRSRGLYVCLDLRVACHQDGAIEADSKKEEARRSIVVHLVFDRRSNYTKVWSVINDSWMKPEPGAFTMKSDHDSCWRTEGFRDVTDAYFTILHDLRANLPPSFRDIHEFSTIHSINWVEIEWEKDPDDERGYRKVLTHLKNNPDLATLNWPPR